ncbi:MAG TPA: CotH kinase family protein [Ruminococcus sp.]|nr:CotH kinase family protein [Ruminococcus sp.]
MKRFYRRTAAGIMSLALALTSAGFNAAPTAEAAAQGVTINEVCPKNTIYPGPDGGLYDYVELYNSSGSSVDISGWGLSDKETKPYRYIFPSGTIIDAGQYLTVFCDGTAGETNPAIVPFGLSTSGETLTLTDTSGNTISTVTFESLASDTSYGQYPDGSGEYFTLKTTPNAANAAPESSNAVRLPEFSAESGFYGSEFQLTINAPQGTTVYYTTDGSDPTTASERYSGAIRVYDKTDEPNVYSARTDISADNVTAPANNVDKAMIVRAVAVDGQGRVSDIVTKTYFVGTTNGSYYKNMKVISLVTDPDNLFDYEKGIYVKGKIYDDKYGTQTPGNPGIPGNPGNPGGQQDPGGQENPGGQQNPGGPGNWGNWGNIGDWGDFGDWGIGVVNSWEREANYTQHGREWERPASIEVFDNGQSVLAQNVGIRIKGAASRNTPQKSFNLYARMDYGKGEFEYDFFDGRAAKAKNGKTIKKYEGVTIRNGGNDNGGMFFRDSVNQRLVADRNMAVEATSECMVFIDGEFWGIYQLIERVSDDYINSHYGIKKSDAVIVKNGELEEGTDQDLQDWNQLAQTYASADMSSDQMYEQLCEKLDIQSYIDYFAAQIYWNNADWPQNNYAVWRTASVDETNPYADGKWRMFLFDTEYSTGLYNMNTGAGDNAFTRIQRNSDNESRMFINLLKNQKFREQFNLTMMDLINYNFDNEKAQAVIDYFDQNFRQQILDTFERYSIGKSSFGGGSPEQTYTSALRTVQNFYSQRAQNIQQHMRQATSLTGNTNTLTVNNQTDKGVVKVNTIKLTDNDQKYSGQYYDEQTMTISAEPKEGYKFKTWDISGGDLAGIDTKSSVISFKLSSDVNVTAVYEADNGSDIITTTTTTTSSSATTTTTTTTPPDTDRVWGDADCDGVVKMNDAVLIMQSISNADKYGVDSNEKGHITAEGQKNANVYENSTSGVTPQDALYIQKWLLNMFPSLDPKDFRPL